MFPDNIEDWVPAASPMVPQTEDIYLHHLSGLMKSANAKIALHLIHNEMKIGITKEAMESLSDGADFLRLGKFL